MTERVRDTGDEFVLYDDQHELLRVTRPTRLLGAALGGVHVLDGGSLIAAGIINQRLMVDGGGACYASGYIRAIPKVARGGLLDVTGHLDPVRWPAANIDGTILIAVGARYGKQVVTADGALAPLDATTHVGASEAAPRFHIVRGGPAPVLDASVEA